MGIDVLPLVKAGLMLLAAGAVAIGALSLLPRTAAQARSVWPIYLTELAIVGTVFAAFAVAGWAPLALALLITLRVSYEAATVALGRLTTSEIGGSHAASAPSTMLRMVPLPRKTGEDPGRAGVAAADPPLRSVVEGAEAARLRGTMLPIMLSPATALTALAATWLPLQLTAGAAVAIALVALIILWLRKHRQLTLPNALMETLLFPVLPAVVFTAAAARPEFAGLLLVLFILVETNDSYALLGGKVFGRRQAFPRLSPKKTVEGLAIGALALTATAALVGTAFFGYSLAACAAIAIAVGILSIAGDLAASRLKRVAGVKDYPLFMPRQGGLLDIVDAWLMAGAAVSAAMALSGLAGS